MIEINGIVHEFSVQGSAEPMTMEDLFWVLNWLGDEMKIREIALALLWGISWCSTKMLVFWSYCYFILCPDKVWVSFPKLTKGVSKETCPILTGIIYYIRSFLSLLAEHCQKCKFCLLQMIELILKSDQFFLVTFLAWFPGKNSCLMAPLLLLSAAIILFAGKFLAAALV